MLARDPEANPKLFFRVGRQRPNLFSFRMFELTNEEIRRYSRHLILPEVGLAGQRKIRNTSVLCIGAGGLGSPIAMYLAAAGIGRLGIVDFDTVDYSNLPNDDQDMKFLNISMKLR